MPATTTDSSVTEPTFPQTFYLGFEAVDPTMSVLEVSPPTPSVQRDSSLPASVAAWPCSGGIFAGGSVGVSNGFIFAAGSARLESVDVLAFPVVAKRSDFLCARDAHQKFCKKSPTHRRKLDDKVMAKLEAAPASSSVDIMTMLQTMQAAMHRNQAELHRGFQSLEDKIGWP